MTTSPLHRRHPILACADQVEAALAEVAEVDPAYMGTGDKAEALLRLTSLASQVETLRLRVLAAADDVALDGACRTVADWVAPRTRTDPRVAFALEKLAQALDERWHLVSAGLGEGQVHLEQARVIVRALDRLPDDLTPRVRAEAEARLVADAETFAPRELARLGDRILDIIAPEVGEDQERRALERAERRAEALTRLDFRRRGDGATDISATVPDSYAARLKTYLEAFTSPRQQHEGADAATGVRLPADRLRGEAFCALLERFDPKSLPDHGGLATTLTLTMTHEQLLSGLGAAKLGTGDPLTAGQARRLACSAGLVPAVLGSKSEVLDLGRTSRLFSPAQRKALALQHPTCRAEDCEAPAPWCEAHHLVPWRRGGKTDLADGILLCHWHHKRAHDQRYSTQTTTERGPPLPPKDVRVMRLPTPARGATSHWVPWQRTVARTEEAS